MFVLIFSVDATPVNADPSSAGKAPLNFDAVRVDILASATVPVKLPAGSAVKLAPDPIWVHFPPLVLVI